MSNSMLATPEAARWLSVLAKCTERLNSVLATLGPDECDWAPDIGIATAKEHLWAIAESERNLTAQMTRGEEASRSYQAQDVAFEEIRRILGICDRNLTGWLEDQPEREFSPESTQAFLDHLELKAHHTAAIALLSQLIDPTRLPPLLF